MTSPIPGRLLLLDVNAAGELTQIFPNQFATNDAISLVQAKQPILVPGAGYGFSGFRAVEPLGRGRLLAIVMPQSLPSEQRAHVRAETVRGFKPVQAPIEYLDRILQQATLASRDASSSGTGMSSWGFALSDYEIVQ